MTRRVIIASIAFLSTLAHAAGPTNVSAFYARGDALIKTLISISTNLPTPGGDIPCTTNEMTVNLLSAHASTANAGTYASGSFTPTTNALLFAAYSGSPTGTQVVTNTGSTQLVWRELLKTNYNTLASPAGFLSVWVTQLPQGTAPFAMTVVVNQASGTGRNMIVGEVTGTDQTAAYGTNAIVQVVGGGATASSNPTNEFAAPGNNGENTLLFVVGDDLNQGADNAATLSWTELWETNYNTPAHGLSVYYSNNVPAAVVTATNTATSRDWATIVLEIKPGTANCGDSFLVKQNFEGTGYDNSETWTEAGGGVKDEDYTATVLRGSQSLRINGIGDVGNTYTTFTAQNTAYGYCIFRPIALGTSSAYLIRFEDSSGNLRGGVRIYAAGDVGINHGSAEDFCTDKVTAGTTYHFWWRYTLGSGANGVASVGFATSATEPTSGTKFKSISNGTSTTQVGRIRLYADTDATGDWIFDHVIVDETTIGSNPP